jgi:hypothetical protein
MENTPYKLELPSPVSAEQIELVQKAIITMMASIKDANVEGKLDIEINSWPGHTSEDGTMLTQLIIRSKGPIQWTLGSQVSHEGILSPSRTEGSSASLS